MEYYSVIKRGMKLGHLQRWQMDLESVIQSEVSQIKTTIIWYCLSMESKKIYGYGGEEGSEEINWEIRTDIYTFSSVTQSCPTLQPHWLRHTRLPRPSRSPRACSNSCPLSHWCQLTISCSVIFLDMNLAQDPFKFLLLPWGSGVCKMLWAPIKTAVYFDSPFHHPQIKPHQPESHTLKALSSRWSTSG